MYKKNKPAKTTLKVNTSYKGERIEEKIERIMNNKEPISDGAPIVYTDRKDGVKPEYDIRTDRWDVALDAMDKVSSSHIARREQRLKEREEAKIVKMKGEDKKEGTNGNNGENQ